MTLKNEAITKVINTQQRRMVLILSPSDIPTLGNISVLSKRVFGLVKKHSVIYRIDLFLSRNYLNKSYRDGNQKFKRFLQGQLA